MDLDLAIWHINPAAEYRLNAAKNAITEWRGPGAQPTQAQLQAAWDAYQAEQATLAQQQQAATTERTAATDDVRTNAQQMMNDLNAIIARNGVFTQAQVGAAIDTLAKDVKRLVRKLAADNAQS